MHDLQARRAGPQPPLLAPLTLVLGGARSGKSRFAERLLDSHRGRRIYLATAEAGDCEMAARIAEHRARRGDGWMTVEEKLELTGRLEDLSRPGVAILVDCLTVWVSNLMTAGRDVAAEGARLCDSLPRLTGPVVFVSNEVGLGIVPDNALARAFRDAAGRLNQEIAARCHRVHLLAAGLPVTLKDALPFGIQPNQGHTEPWQ